MELVTTFGMNELTHEESKKIDGGSLLLGALLGYIACETANEIVKDKTGKSIGEHGRDLSYIGHAYFDGHQIVIV